MIHRSLRHPALPLFTLLALGGCHEPAPVAARPWTMVVRHVEAPAGGSAAPIERCSPRSNACAPITEGAAIEGDQVLRTAPGARVSIEGGGVRVEMAGGASAAITGERLRLDRGAFALQITPAAPARVEAGGRFVSADGAPAEISVRAIDGGRADVSVLRGRVLVSEGGGALALASGQSAIVHADRPVERRVGVRVDAVVERRDLPAPLEPAPAAPRGLGTMTARVPGTTEVIAGVRLVSHHVEVVVRDGFARTEVEEEWANDTARVLEGRYVFPVPPDASISRLALWVGKDLVEGEIVERERAATIFKGIVEDTVRPRDPALLEWTRGSEVSLKIFPIPARASRKVVLAYDQALGSRAGRTRYVYPLSLGADRTTRVGDFALRVTASHAGGPLEGAETPGYAASIAADRGGLAVSFAARDFTPAGDFVLGFDEPPAPSASSPAVVPAAHVSGAPGDRFVAVRVPVEWPASAPPPARVRRDRAVIVDVSHSQSKDTLAAEIALAEGMIAALDGDERFVLLACDSACATYPEDGLAAANEGALDEARAFLRGRELGGSSDVAGALLAAARRLDPGGAGQVVMIGDGSPTSGELSAEAIAARVRPEIAARGIDLRLFGAGRTVDAVVLEGLARALDASYERLGDGEPIARHVADLTLSLRAPLLRGASLAASPELVDVSPRVLPSLRVGSEVLVLARLRDGATGEVRLTGDLGGVAFAAARSVSARESSPVVPRLWAASRIAALEASSDAASVAEVIALSKRHHVLSRRTSLLVLENDRMFAEFGIARTPRVPDLDEPAPATAGPGLGSIGALGFGAGHGRMPAGSASPSISMSFGSGGLGLSGIGEGGGGARPADKQVEITAPRDGGQGVAEGIGRLGGSHVARAPRVRMGATRVSGRLPPEVIQRIVRQQFGRFRRCYENGLRGDPNLAGRVSVRFMINAEGDVMNVASGGGDLTNSAVVACVVRAFQGLRFPAPEGGIVTVTYPIVFAPDGGASPAAAPMSWASPTFLGPSVTHAPGDDRWMSQGAEAIDKLVKALDEQGESRRRHEDLVRGLLTRGRFTEALTAARRFADRDPDLRRALELLAGAAAAAGEAAVARTAIDALVELAPESVDLHTRAARAFEAAGDEARACAHWRSRSSLGPRDADARHQALRCRARLGERDAVLAEIAAEDRPSKLIASLRDKLAAGAAPAYDASGASPGTFEATVRCADEAARCPVVVIVKPSGDVVSPWSPAPARVSARSAALTAGLDGTYRTLLVGGAPDARGEVVLRAHDVTRTFRFDRGGLQTIAATTIRSPSSSFR